MFACRMSLRCSRHSQQACNRDRWSELISWDTEETWRSMRNSAPPHAAKVPDNRQRPTLQLLFFLSRLRPLRPGVTQRIEAQSRSDAAADICAHYANRNCPLAG